LHQLEPPASRACRNYLLPPRTTTAQRAAISSPPQALFVFQTNGTPGLYNYLTLCSGLRARVCPALPAGFCSAGAGARDLRQGLPTPPYPSRRLETKRQRGGA